MFPKLQIEQSMKNECCLPPRLRVSYSIWCLLSLTPTDICFRSLRVGSYLPSVLRYSFVAFVVCLVCFVYVLRCCLFTLNSHSSRPIESGVFRLSCSAFLYVVSQLSFFRSVVFWFVKCSRSTIVSCLIYFVL